MFKRTALIAVTVVAAAAPSAQARIISDGPTSPSTTTPVEVQAPGVTRSSRYASMAAHRETIANRHWQLADNAPVFAISRPVESGFDWLSALAGGLAVVLLALALFLIRPTLRPRRVGAVA